MEVTSSMRAAAGAAGHFPAVAADSQAHTNEAVTEECGGEQQDDE